MSDKLVPADLADRMLREIERQGAEITAQAAEIERLKDVRRAWRARSLQNLVEVERQAAEVAHLTEKMERAVAAVAHFTHRYNEDLAKIAAQAEAIKARPHESMCEALGTREDLCNCWKAAALAPAPTKGGE